MSDSFTQMLRDWQGFYLLVGTAAATLIGLIFVAISLGADLVIPDTVTTAHTWVTPIIIHFGMVLMIAALIAVPTLTSLSLGGLLGLAGVTGLAYVCIIGVRLWRQVRSTPEFSGTLMAYIAVPIASYLLILATAIGLALNMSEVLNGLALAVILLLAISLRNAWQLALWFTVRRR